MAATIKGSLTFVSHSHGLAGQDTELIHPPSKSVKGYSGGP